MAQSPIEVTTDAEDFVRFLGMTSTLKPELKTSLRKRVKGAGKAAQEAVQAEVRKPPLHRGKGTRIEGKPQSRGLRSKIAQGVRVSIATTKPDTAGVTIKASPKALPADQKKLLKAYNSEKGWRHPGLKGARRISKAKSASASLRGAGGLGKALTDTARNTTKWYQQKGRPYFGKVLEARKPELADAVTQAVQDARKASGLP